MKLIALEKFWLLKEVSMPFLVKRNILLTSGNSRVFQIKQNSISFNYLILKPINSTSLFK